MHTPSASCAPSGATGAARSSRLEGGDHPGLRDEIMTGLSEKIMTGLSEKIIPA
jgi:hypothetical protein